MACIAEIDSQTVPCVFASCLHQVGCFGLPHATDEKLQQSSKGCCNSSLQSLCCNYSLWYAAYALNKRASTTVYALEATGRHASPCLTPAVTALDSFAS